MKLYGFLFETGYYDKRLLDRLVTVDTILNRSRIYYDNSCFYSKVTYYIISRIQTNVTISMILSKRDKIGDFYLTQVTVMLDINNVERFDFEDVPMCPVYLEDDGTVLIPKKRMIIKSVSFLSGLFDVK